MAFAFVSPETVRLDLGDGDWIEVKRELTFGEQQAARTSGFKYMEGTARDENDPSADAEKSTMRIGVDWKRTRVARVLAYGIDWNAKDAQGAPVPFGQQALEALSEADFERIEEAINAHVKETAKGKAKTPSTAQPSNNS